MYDLKKLFFTNKSRGIINKSRNDSLIEKMSKMMFFQSIIYISDITKK